MKLKMKLCVLEHFFPDFFFSFQNLFVIVCYFCCREREETITDKEKRIFDLKKKNQELEKFRFVLDYKIKELKLQIAPREHEIATMRKQIEEMDLELEQYHKSNEALNLMISELKLKIDGIRREMESQERRVDMNARLTEKYKRGLQDLWEVRDDQNILRGKVVDMYRVYVQEDMIAAQAAVASGGAKSSTSSSSSSSSADKNDNEDPQQLYNRDREQMERSLDSLRRALKTGTKAHQRDLNKMVKDSVVLTKELNTLRKDARKLHLQKKAIDQTEAGHGGDLSELMVLLGVEVRSQAQSSISAKKSFTAGATSSAGGGGGRSGGISGNSGPLPIPPPPPSSSSSTLLLPGRPVHRTSALRTTSASGRQDSRVDSTTSQHDHWEAWKELDMQSKLMKQLETRLEALCGALCLDPNQIIFNIDLNLLRST